MKIPQADDVTKIMDLPLAIAERINTTKLVAERYGFDQRQSSYYLEAAEILGLVSSRGSKYVLNEDGKKYLLMDISQRKSVLIRKMVIVPIISRIIAELLVTENQMLSKRDIELLIQESSPVRGSTVPRRAQTIMSWFRWVGEETGAFYCDAKGIRLRSGDNRKLAPQD